MKFRKILTTLVVVAMLASAFIVVNKLSNVKIIGKASAGTPGYDAWQANYAGTQEIINSTTISGPLTFTDQQNYIYLNGTVINTDVYGTNLYLYKPGYSCDSNTYNVNVTYTKVGSFDTSGALASREPWIQTITNTPGFWFISNQSVGQFGALGTATKVNMANLSVYNSGYSYNDGWSQIAGWFWVNSSTSGYTLSLTKNSFTYGVDEPLTISILDEALNPVTGTWYIDIWNMDAVTQSYVGNPTLVYHKQVTTGTWTLSNFSTYTWPKGAGTYRVAAYSDTGSSADCIYTMGNGQGSTNAAYGYNSTFGNVSYWSGRFISSSPTSRILNSNGDLINTNTWVDATYRWVNCGPFNPPEYWVDYTNITVNPGVPSVSVVNGTHFWNDTADKEFKFAVTDYYGTDLAGLTIDLYNSSNNPVSSGATAISTDLYNYSTSGATITIVADGAVGNRWGWNSTLKHGIWAPRGTLYVKIYKSSVGNSSKEWNGTVSLTLTTATNKFEWLNDGSTGSDKLTDGELGKIPAKADIPVWIQFYIVSDDFWYWGDGNGGETTQKAAENITITGDSLFTGRLVDMPHWSESWFGANASNAWSVPIVPLMNTNGGEITITANAWNNTITGKLSIGGTSAWANGTVVTVDPNQFNIDVENKTLTITVKNSQGGDIPYATVTLYYIDDTKWGGASAAGGLRDGANELVDQRTSSTGTYTITFNLTQQTTNQSATSHLASDSAPRNLTVYVQSGSGSTALYGYALIEMDRNSDLQAGISRNTMLAGYVYDTLTFNCTKVGSTSTPSTVAADKNNFAFYVYDGDHNDVTSTIFNDGDITAADLDDEYTITLSNVYVRTPGKYYIYAKNLTHDSTDLNASLTVDQVEVTCDKAPLIWKHDANISATFSVRYNGEALAGNLIIDNVSDVGDYNVTYKNVSVNFAASDSATTDATNTTYLTITSSDFVAGDATVYDLTADILDPLQSVQNITFWFQPIDEYDIEGHYARALGKLEVRVPIVKFDAKDGDADAKDIKYLSVYNTGAQAVNAFVTGRAGELLPDIFIGLSGQGVTKNTTTGTSGSDLGKAVFSITPSSTGNITVAVGEDGRTVTLPVIIVTSWVLDLSMDVEVSEGEDFTVTVTRTDTGAAVEDVAVTVEGIAGATTTNADGKATFKAPEVASDRELTVTATLQGYKEATDTIVDLNVPKITASVRPATAKQGAEVTVIVSKDDATPAVNAKVTVEGDTTEYYTDGNGQVTITAPSTDGTYTVTATFGDFKKGEATLTVDGKAEGTPGFELLTLVIAIGVAFILLRRRRK